jgi:hypothetical protein
MAGAMAASRRHGRKAAYEKSHENKSKNGGKSAAEKWHGGISSVSRRKSQRKMAAIGEMKNERKKWRKK